MIALITSTWRWIMKTNKMILVSLGVVINIVLGIVVKWTGIPLLFLDTVGTIFNAIILGPWYGALTGGLSNLIMGILTNPIEIPFALVNIAVGLIVGFSFKKLELNLLNGLIVGLVISIVAPLIGTTIAVYVFGGLTGSMYEVIFLGLKNAGHKIFAAAFIPRITGNLVDKIASVLIVIAVLKKLPKSMIERFNG
jgi:energy-coupling factor transport system substrate-specific component